MNYTQSAIDSLAQLWSKLSGLDLSVARAQVTAEQGVNGNVLGLTVKNGAATGVYPGQTGVAQASDGQWLATFATPQAGIEAAAWNLKNNPAYVALRSAIATGNPAIQAHALVTSQWGPTGYYAGSSAFRGLSGVQPVQPLPGPTPPPSPSAPASPGALPGSAATASGSKSLSPLDILQIATTGNPLNPLIAAANQGPTAAKQAQQVAQEATSIPQALAALPGNLAAAAAPFVVTGVVLLLVGWLAVTGVRDVLSGDDGEAGDEPEMVEDGADEGDDTDSDGSDEDDESSGITEEHWSNLRARHNRPDATPRRTHAFAVYASGRRVHGSITASRDQARRWASGLRSTYTDQPATKRPTITVRQIRVPA